MKPSKMLRCVLKRIRSVAGAFADNRQVVHIQNCWVKAGRIEPQFATQGTTGMICHAITRAQK